VGDILSGQRSLRQRASDFQERTETAITRGLLVGIFALGLIAQFVKPVGDALEDKVFLGGALFTSVCYALYSSVQRLLTLMTPAVRDRVKSEVFAEEFKEAFKKQDVRISFIGFTSETVHEHIRQNLDTLRTATTGRAKSVKIRIILPDFWEPSVLPGRLTSEGKFVDYPELRADLQGEIRRYRRVLLQRRSNEGIELDVSYKFLPMPAMLKLCIINDRLVFEGHYNFLVKKKYAMTSADPDMIDLLGYESMLTRWHPAGGVDAVEEIERWRDYFEKLWSGSYERESELDLSPP
jgi:hypothetical protein